MLFDLRSRGRRRTVRVLYIGLALLMGVGLVGFGVGTGFGGGGIFNAATENQGANGASYSSEISKYRKLTKQQPSNVAAWEKLAKSLLHEAGKEEYVNPRTGEVSSKGKELYAQAASAWSSYIALNPPKPNTELAQLMVGVYGEAGLNQPAQAVQVLQTVVAARPILRYYYELADYAYKAKNTRLGDLASEKAVSLAPASDRKRIKNELAEIKKPGSSGQTFTTKTNGKTYVVKPTGGGNYSGTELKTTPAPAGTTSTSKKK